MRSIISHMVYRGLLFNAWCNEFRRGFCTLVLSFCYMFPQKKGTEVMIIGSVTAPPIPTFWRSTFWRSTPPTVVPLTPPDLSYKDHAEITKLGVPLEERDNHNVILALYKKTKWHHIVSSHVSMPGLELSAQDVLDHIEVFFSQTTKNGKRCKIY